MTHTTHKHWLKFTAFAIAVFGPVFSLGSTPATDEAARLTLDILLAELPPKQAVKLAATLTGVPRDVLYAYAVARRQATEA